MGGGTIEDRLNAALRQGLSPRGRGNRVSDVGDPRDLRSIPAWAGEPTRRGPPTEDTQRSIPAWAGEPTRLVDGQPRGGYARSIPAWAGEPRACGWTTRLRWVYPRVGGGTVAVAGRGPLSPRGRGTLIGAETRRWLLTVYPRVGGEPASYGHQTSAQRSIPAWAGEPCY